MGNELLNADLEKIVKGKPQSIAGFMLLGGQLRRVYFPAIGTQRVVWRKLYCLTEDEAVNEADKFRHAALHAIVRPSSPPQVRNTNAIHWTEKLSQHAYACVKKILAHCRLPSQSPAFAKLGWRPSWRAV